MMKFVFSKEISRSVIGVPCNGAIDVRTRYAKYFLNKFFFKTIIINFEDFLHDRHVI